MYYKNYHCKNKEYSYLFKMQSVLVTKEYNLRRYYERNQKNYDWYLEEMCDGNGWKEKG